MSCLSTFSSHLRCHDPEAWEPPQFQEKRPRSKKAILGALGEFRGILGAALGIRNSILRMASHDLINTKTNILGATPGAIPGIDGNPHERFSFAPAFSERFVKNWGGPRAPEQWQASICTLGSTLSFVQIFVSSGVVPTDRTKADSRFGSQKWPTFLIPGCFPWRSTENSQSRCFLRACLFW